MQFPNLQMRGRYQKLKQPSLATPSEAFDQFINSLFWFLIIVCMHTVAMMIFEDLILKDALWLTMTSITTVGYGDLSAKTDMGRLSTVILIYIGGIALLAKLAAEYIDHHLEKRDRKIKGLWEWSNMKDHLLIINTPEQDTVRYLTRLIEQIKITPSLAEMPIQVVSDHFPEGLPHSVRDAGVVHIHGRAENSDFLDKLNLKHAKYIIIVARDYGDSVSDSINFDILHRIGDYKTTSFILAEVVDDKNRQRFRVHGADSVVRPIRAYPEIVTRALEAPGTEQILENLFTHKGDFPRRFEVIIRNMHWAELCSRIIDAGIGLPLGYIDDHNKVITNPDSNHQAHGDSLIILVNEAKMVDDDDVAKALHGKEGDQDIS